MFRTSLLDPYHALHMTDFYLSVKIQLSSQATFQDLDLFSQRPPLVQLNRPEIFLIAYPVEDISRPRPVQLNRPKIFLIAYPVKGLSGSVRSTLRSP